jgi:hypothetical protein
VIVPEGPARRTAEQHDATTDPNAYQAAELRRQIDRELEQYERSRRA